jgi:hypothetical protein
VTGATHQRDQRLKAASEQKQTTKKFLSRSFTFFSIYTKNETGNTNSATLVI